MVWPCEKNAGWTFTTQDASLATKQHKASCRPRKRWIDNTQEAVRSRGWGRAFLPVRRSKMLERLHRQAFGLPVIKAVQEGYTRSPCNATELAFQFSSVLSLSALLRRNWTKLIFHFSSFMSLCKRLRSCETENYCCSTSDAIYFYTFLYSVICLSRSCLPALTVWWI